MKTSIRIPNARTLETTVQKRVKQVKFNQLMNQQLNSIESTMSEYRNSCTFVFTDYNNYRRDFEQAWKTEFVQAAVELFEKKGYTVRKEGAYTIIKW